MKKKRIKKIWIIIIVLLILIGFGYYLINSNDKKTNKKDVKVLDEIKEYGYYLNDNDISIYKDEFKNLAKILENKTINYEDYAESITKLFIIDFFDLNSKITNSDVGGTQFIYSKNVDNFVLNAKNTIYKNVESNIYGDRKQSLPKIDKVLVEDIKDSTFEIDKNKFDSYELKVKINYKNDLDFPENILVIVVRNDKKLEIVKIETSK